MRGAGWDGDAEIHEFGMDFGVGRFGHESARSVRCVVSSWVVARAEFAGS